MERFDSHFIGTLIFRRISIYINIYTYKLEHGSHWLDARSSSRKTRYTNVLVKVPVQNYHNHNKPKIIRFFKYNDFD
jgi:hypothetical protein